MSIEIRKATIEDANAIVNININSWIDTYKDIFPSGFLNSLDSKREDTVNKCINKIDEYHVAIIDDIVVGFVRYGLNKKEYSNEYAEIYSLYIDSDYRGNGIGRKLLKYSFENLKNEYKYCLISTLVENRANSFYKRNGGKLVGTSDFILLNQIYKENIYLFDLNL